MVLPVIALSVVPVASKNINNGEITGPRTTFAFKVSGPLVPVQDDPVGGGLLEVTVTVAD